LYNFLQNQKSNQYREIKFDCCTLANIDVLEPKRYCKMLDLTLDYSQVEGPKRKKVVLTPEEQYEEGNNKH